ncbi:uncharacterized protein LOC129754130 [Uranotaenia lowii]|uniref:uncharacterized protein LOC129754130 n=1 Tax=Uranotaenia lowii TaxID=190385 RepID=UPI002478FF5C|nr:uncharacterized protein LOC129754130 [Uranotaenia lowii]
MSPDVFYFVSIFLVIVTAFETSKELETSESIEMQRCCKTPNPLSKETLAECASFEPKCPLRCVASKVFDIGRFSILMAHHTDSFDSLGLYWNSVLQCVKLLEVEPLVDDVFMFLEGNGTFAEAFCNVRPEFEPFVDCYNEHFYKNCKNWVEAENCANLVIKNEKRMPYGAF